MTIKDFLLRQIEQVAVAYKYDFLYEVDEEFICQIIKRDMNGEILGTPLTLKLEIDEENGEGVVIFYNEQGEFKQIEFTIEKPETIAEIVLFIQERLSINSKSKYSVLVEKPTP